MGPDVAVGVGGMQAFYNDAINSELESEEGNPRFTVSEEYHRWRQDLRAVRQNRQQSGGGGGAGAPARGRYEVRSLICYPFVLDPAIKVRTTTTSSHTREYSS